MQTSAPPDYRHLTFLGDEPPPKVSRATPPRPPRPLVPAAPLDSASAGFFDALCRPWGLNVSMYRDSILVRRQSACLRALRAASPADGIRALGRDPTAAERALGSLMIGVTGFFRDPAVFDALRPMLRPLSRATEPLRALSIGCSDGSELYSLAMLLAEEGLLGDAVLRGVDGRPSAIAAARTGVYTGTAAEAVPADWRSRYFLPVARQVVGAGSAPGHLRVTEDLRAACDWLAADAFSFEAAAPDEPGGLGDQDVILCRNLAIYLTPDAAARLWRLCIARLRPGGLLVTGKAERPPADGRSGLSRLATCIYRRNPLTCPPP